MRTDRCELNYSPSALGTTKITQMSLPRGLRPCGFREAAALAFRRRARNQALHGLAGAGWTSGCVGKTDQQFDNLVTFSAMETIKRHNRFSSTADRGAARRSGFSIQAMAVASPGLSATAKTSAARGSAGTGPIRAVPCRASLRWRERGALSRKPQSGFQRSFRYARSRGVVGRRPVPATPSRFVSNMTGCVGRSTFARSRLQIRFALRPIGQLRLRKADVAGLARIVQIFGCREISDGACCEWRSRYDDQCACLPRTTIRVETGLGEYCALSVPRRVVAR